MKMYDNSKLRLEKLNKQNYKQLQIIFLLLVLCSILLLKIWKKYECNNLKFKLEKNKHEIILYLLSIFSKKKIAFLNI